MKRVKDQIVDVLISRNEYNKFCFDYYVKNREKANIFDIIFITLKINLNYYCYKIHFFRYPKSFNYLKKAEKYLYKISMKNDNQVFVKDYLLYELLNLYYFIPQFPYYRMRAEKELLETNSCVSIHEIYDLLEKWMGINPENLKTKEIELREQFKKKNFNFYLYTDFVKKNVIIAYGMNKLNSCIYMNLIISHHLKEDVRSIFYEYGFLCGGILVWSFCRWLDDFVKMSGTEKIIFVARDGKIISSIYKKYFNSIDSEYIFFSRSAADKITLNDWYEEFVEQNIKIHFDAVGKEKKIADIMNFAGLNFVLDKDTFFDSASTKNCKYREIRDKLYDNKNWVMQNYDSSRRAGKKYIGNAIKGYKKICVVDMGWHGSSIASIKHIVSEISTGVDVTGAMVVAEEMGYVDSFFSFDRIKSYATTSEYEEIRKIANKTNTRYAFELLFSASDLSLISYSSDTDGNGSNKEFLWEKNNCRADDIKEIHRGIENYIKEYVEFMGEYSKQISFSVRDSIVPTALFLSDKKNLKGLIGGDSFSKGFRHSNEKT